MDRSIEERYYFVTRGLTSGKEKVYSRGDIQLSYGLALFLLGLFFAYILLRDMDLEAVGFVVIMMAIILPLFYFSFASGREEARAYIERHGPEIIDKKV